ncbi:MAG TPA: nucleoside hydrolase [Steroidobacteraceae bacterium]|nr:nucleoside hydrolase [Steroidobacteraceae bacterium]
MSDPHRNRRRIIIDTDPGVDDALAIFLALKSPELHVEALTVVAGNVTLDLTVANALRLLEIAGRPDIPVAAGAARPLKRHLVRAHSVHGPNGLAGVEFPAPKIKPVAESGPRLIRRMVAAAPGHVSIVAIGPLTNVALALREDPNLASQVRDITIMGGSLSGGNTTPAAEFNSYVDPEAARIVYESGIPITMIGLDVTRRAVLGEDRISALEASGDAAARAAGRIMRATHERVGHTGANGGRLLVHDAIAVAALIDPSILTTHEHRVEVETEGRLTAGQTVGYRKGRPMRHSAPLLHADPPSEGAAFQPNAKVALDIDVERFLTLLIDRLTR